MVVKSVERWDALALVLIGVGDDAPAYEVWETAAFEAKLQAALLLDIGQRIVATHLAGIFTGAALDLVEVFVALCLVAAIGGKFSLGGKQKYVSIAEEDDVLGNLVNYDTLLGTRRNLGAEVSGIAIDGLAFLYAQRNLNKLLVGLESLVEAPAVFTLHFDECLVEFLAGVEETV